MLTIHDHINLVSDNNTRLIKKITEPLLIHFGISYFCYQKVTHDGHWSLVSNNAEWLQHSAVKEFYRYDPTLINPKFYHRRGSTLPEQHDDINLKETLLKDAIELYDLCHSLAIIEPTFDGCEYFFFGTSEKNTDIYNVYIQQLNTLKTFTRYFKENAFSLQEIMLNNPVDVRLLIGDSFDKNDNVLSTYNSDTLNFDFIKDLNKTFQLPLLTAREQDCLQYLLAGKTAKETAKALGISSRTVEEYLIQLRRKLRCKDKGEILSKFL